ncbi:MAG TPA: IclR family transcriptional regulator [Alphaproteobacteria bacterium]|nr:IclR family transcriptional regulator [Alphaproteobacteria bacterium]
MSKTIAKAIRLIETLAREPPPHGVSELARALGLNKTTVHRLLNGLARLGYVKQGDRAGTYELTMKLWEIGTHILAQRDVSRIATGILRELAGQTGETVHLAIPDGQDVVYIDKADGAHPLRIFTPIGGRVPLYCGSTGKCVLAFQAPAFIDSVGRNLKAFTPRTITAPARLLRELETVRQQGYAINVGEWRIGISGVAAPIRDRVGTVVASVGASGPSNRLPVSALRAMSPLVIASAARISAELGFITSPANRAAAGALAGWHDGEGATSGRRGVPSSSRSKAGARKGRTVAPAGLR